MSNTRTPKKSPPASKYQLIRQTKLNKNGIPAIELFADDEDE